MTEQVFKPSVSVYIPTSKIHDDNIFYKASYGYENPNPAELVFKVQMSEGTNVKGRQAPTYTDTDFDRVFKAKKRLKYVLDMGTETLLDNVIDYKELMQMSI